uniref:Uncharacterized protein n=1 Tax=Anopheles quadriannulatus TaxID=34691 RepID=A0A182WUY3_ANOQN
MDDERLDHLKQLPWPEYRDARPQLLIGLGNLRLAVPLKTRKALALECLERRMERDPKLKTVVHHHIADMMEKGYIHKETSAELAECNSKRIWYLPLGVITNPKKPGKVRIIWDVVPK